MKIDDGDEYERLLGSLLEDQRVAPILLQDGRPKTVHQCVRALYHWCGLPSTDGETLGKLDDMAKTIGRMGLVQRSNVVRLDVLLGVQILNNRYGVTKDMRDRVSTREGEDDDALRRYLTWEGTAPDCWKLEAALFKVLRRLPQWQEMRLSITSRLLPRTKWVQAIVDVVDAGLSVLFNKSGWILELGAWEVSCSLENSVLMLALNLPGHEESLIAAYARTFPILAARWKVTFANASFADELFQATISLWQTTLKELDIRSGYKKHHVKMLAYIFCMLSPIGQENEDIRGGRNKLKKQRVKKHAQHGKGKAKKRPHDDIIGDILKDFIEEAGPILEATYGKA
jgi:hypothetical protein